MLTTVPQSNEVKLLHNARIVGECYRIRTLFDTEAGKQDKDYVAIIEDTWIRAFRDTNPDILAEAVHEFILTDKKGFLPKPGQIVEMISKGIKDVERRKYYSNVEKLNQQLLYKNYNV